MKLNNVILTVPDVMGWSRKDTLALTKWLNAYTQEKLGEVVGISTEQVSNIERATSRTRIETAAGIAKALDVRLADLFDLPMFDTRSKKKTDAIKEHLAFLLKQDEAFIDLASIRFNSYPHTNTT